ncbi:hypothetical protein AWC05_04795 [Mycobacterium florentinum]|uniref:Uncharacterized protein n=1 Tax=Mycobacterium florentinum TaxID=292462 RepID=A0A1X1TTH6_MYCFL|nr:hypothetical protein [Mycobacterium florentinum]MCV7408340.1 hypothetical protein [Mycobacterium florentinum]ORV47907.1 hypothetical protein AWC05_04795 [Mycobacterium florentinum]
MGSELVLAPIRRTDDGDDGLQVASPITLSATPVTYRTRAPRLGEHSSDIRAWLDTTARGHSRPGEQDVVTLDCPKPPGWSDSSESSDSLESSESSESRHSSRSWGSSRSWDS